MLPMQNLIKPPAHLKKIHVLVVDHDPRIRLLLSNVLKYFGFSNVFEAEDGFKAVKAMRNHDIDLIITDWELNTPISDAMAGLPTNPIFSSEQWLPAPPKSGATLIKYIRTSKYSPNPYISIIMFTGLGLRNRVEYARDLGVNEIILKPLSVENLCRRITAIIDSPRPFVLSEQYKGPCRRREEKPFPVANERRRRDIKIFKHAG